jgi:UDP-glucose 4-epimerase
MKIVVTGGAGFIGSHVVDLYVSRGHEVLVVDNLVTGKRANLNPKARFVEQDIGDPKTADLIRREKPDVVNHHAAQMDVRKSVADPAFDASVNVLGMINMLEGAREVGVEKVLFASSGGATYGEQTEFPAPESHPHNPLSPYGITKATGEHYLFYYHAVYGMPYVALRYANVYGPRQDPHGEAGVVAIFGNRLRTGRPITIYGDGNQTRDYVYVGDVARANLLAADATMPGPDGTIDPWGINIGTETATSVTELARAMMRSAKVEVKVEHAAARPGELLESVVRIDKAARVLGWKPAVSLAEGLARTYAWIVEDAS